MADGRIGRKWEDAAGLAAFVGIFLALWTLL